MIEFIIGLITGIGSQYALYVIIKLHKETKKLKTDKKKPADTSYMNNYCK